MINALYPQNMCKIEKNKKTKQNQPPSLYLVLPPTCCHFVGLKHHMTNSIIPNNKGEKNVTTLAALPTGGSPFCGALEDGMGEVFVSVGKSTSVVEVIGRGSSIQGVAWTATLQSLHVPISMSLAANCMIYSFPA